VEKRKQEERRRDGKDCDEYDSVREVWRRPRRLEG